jgi:hypothetical protein
MPYPGYLQDLSQLEGQDCLLKDSNQDAALTDSKFLELELLCTAELTSSTLPTVGLTPVMEPHRNITINADVLGLTSGLEVDSEKETSPVILTPSTGPPSIANLLTETKLNQPLHAGFVDLFTALSKKATDINTNENFQTSVDSTLQSQSENIPIVRVNAKSALPSPLENTRGSALQDTTNVNLLQPDLHQTDLSELILENTSQLSAQVSKLKDIINIEPLQPDLHPDIAGLIFKKPYPLPSPFTMSTPTTSLPALPLPTTLATRATEDVIAELKSRVPHALNTLANGRLISHSSSQSGISDLVELSLKPTVRHGVEEEEDQDGDLEDSEDEIQTTVKPRKLSERKRLLNAIADNYIQERNQKIHQEGNKVRPEDEEQQSARWLVNQSEDRQIISTPREYQVELFEKAKEKNLIAVLDTG